MRRVCLRSPPKAHELWACLCVQGFARASKKAVSYMTIAGSVRLFSLSLTYSVRSVSAHRPHTCIGVCVQQDDYMAPEVLMGDKYDEKCDVFGFVISSCVHTDTRTLWGRCHSLLPRSYPRYGAVLAGIVSRRRPKRNEDGLYGFKLDQFKALIPPDCTSFRSLA
jgi:serine/threonine protein kinase